MVMCICVRGSTLARLATVSVFLSIGKTPARRVMFQTGGKPSTWFPSVGLVELYLQGNIFLIYSIQRIIGNYEKY